MQTTSKTLGIRRRLRHRLTTHTKKPVKKQKTNKKHKANHPTTPFFSPPTKINKQNPQKKQEDKQKTKANQSKTGKNQTATKNQPKEQTNKNKKKKKRKKME
jgi:hypothetical protein